MGTEGQWTVHKMPGYTGFIPGTRHIYGRSFGRIPPLAQTKEKKTEASEISQDACRPKNIWQVLLPPVRFIPGYTGHLPGKNYVFGKTFAQQAEECYTNINKVTKRARENKVKEVEMNERENGHLRDKVQAEYRRSLVPVHRERQNVEESYSKHSNYFPQRSEKVYSNDHYANEKPETQEDHDRRKTTRYDLEVEDVAPDGRYEKHQRYRTQSDGLRRYNGERRNPEEMFKHLKYESPLRSKYQSSTDLRSDEQLQGSKVWDHSYDSDRMHSRSDDRPKHVSSSDIHPSESKHHVLANYDFNDQNRVYSGRDRYHIFDSYGADDSRSYGVGCDKQNVREAASNEGTSTGVRDVVERPTHSNQRLDPVDSKEYSTGNREGYDYSTFHKEGDSGKAMTSFHQHEMESSRSSETEHAGQKSVGGGGQVSRGVSPINLDNYTVNSESLQQRIDTIQTAPGSSPAFFLNDYERSRFEPKSVKFEEDRGSIPPISGKSRSGLYRTSYDDYNNSARYFSTALNPPISGYRGYVPRINSTSALGMPFATHINTNVRT